MLYLALAAAFGSPLIFTFKLFWLIPLGLIGAALLQIIIGLSERRRVITSARSDERRDVWAEKILCEWEEFRNAGYTQEHVETSR